MNKRTNILLAAGTIVLAIGIIAAQAAGRDTPRTAWTLAQLTAAETIHTGQVVGQTGGYAYKYISSSTNLTVLGVAQQSAASNSTVSVRSGLFGLKNDGTITAAHLGASAYAATNNSAYTVSASGTAAVGKIVAFTSDYVWVRCGP